MSVDIPTIHQSFRGRAGAAFDADALNGLAGTRRATQQISGGADDVVILPGKIFKGTPFSSAGWTSVAEQSLAEPAAGVTEYIGADGVALSSAAFSAALWTPVAAKMSSDGGGTLDEVADLRPVGRGARLIEIPFQQILTGPMAGKLSKFSVPRSFRVVNWVAWIDTPDATIDFVATLKRNAVTVDTITISAPAAHASGTFGSGALQSSGLWSIEVTATDGNGKPDVFDFRLQVAF